VVVVEEAPTANNAKLFMTLKPKILMNSLSLLEL